MVNSEKLSSIPIHPFLFAGYPVLSLWTLNADVISFTKLAFSLLFFFAAALLLLAITSITLRCKLRAALLTSCILFLFCSYGHSYSFLYGYALNTEMATTCNPTTQHDVHFILSGAYIVLLLISQRLIRSSRLPLNEVTRAVTIISFLQLIYPALLFISSVNDRTNVSDTLLSQPISNNVTGDTPDIYLIVLDGYARADTLAKRYEFDNTPFVNSLTERGFTVAAKSTANYPWTMLSLASTLSMNYLDDLPALLGNTSKKRGEVFRRIRDNNVARFLRKQGYEFIHLQSTWVGTMNNPYADRFITCTKGLWVDEFYRVLLGSTWLKLLETNVGNDLASCHLSNFETLKTLSLPQTREARTGKPKFVIAHFVLPHYPYLFNQHGNVLEHAVISSQFQFHKKLWQEKAPYIEQLKFVNNQMLKLSDALLSNPARQPIIMIQSDHGPHFRPEHIQENLEARFSNFAAYYLPGVSELIPSDITMVNIFPVLLNHYFTAKFELQPTKHYFSDFLAPYRFQEVDPFAPNVSGSRESPGFPAM